MSAFGTKQTSICVASMSALEVKRASIGPEGLFQCASLSRHDPVFSAGNACTVTRYHHPPWTEDGRFRAGLDDVIIIPLVFVTLAASKILRFIFLILMRLLDYAFPLAMQLVWLPLFAAMFLAMASLLSSTGRCASFRFPRRNVDSGVYRSAGTGRGSGEGSATGRSNMLCISPLKTAWHGCSEHVGISRRTPHCS